MYSSFTFHQMVDSSPFVDFKDQKIGTMKDNWTETSVWLR